MAPSEFFDDEAQVQVVPMGVESVEERRKAGWRNEDEEAVATEGLISSADYSGVAMHGHSSPPAHKKHPRPKAFRLRILFSSCVILSGSVSSSLCL